MPCPTPALRALFLPLVLAAACSGGGDGDPIDAGPRFDAPWSPSCIEAMEHSDFEWINEEIFNKSCANFTSCHQGNNPAGSLNMTVPRAYQELVRACPTCPGEPSHYFDDWLRVTPCNPEESYLMVRMRCYSPTDEFGESCVHGPLDGGTLMPPNSRPICGPKIEAIRRWILNGANETGTENTCGTGPDAGPVDAGAIDAPAADAGIPDGAP